MDTSQNLTPCHHVCLNIESDRDDIINERSKPYPITMKRKNRIRLVKNILQNKRILLILSIGFGLIYYKTRATIIYTSSILSKSYNSKQGIISLIVEIWSATCNNGEHFKILLLLHCFRRGLIGILNIVIFKVT